MKRIYLFALLGALGALIVAGCGGGSTGGNETSGSSGGGAATLAATEISGLGSVLVNSEGLAVYEFAKDKGTTSSCYGACEEGWPPVTVASAPTAGEGAAAGQLGTTKRRDGTLQVTYAGHPLYTFVGDKSPGEANGNGSEAFGGLWSVLDEAGSAVEGTATSSSESSETRSYGGY